MKLTDKAENRIGDQALGWLVRYNGDVLWHNGRTSGFSSSMYVDKRARRAVVLLTNADH